MICCRSKSSPSHLQGHTDDIGQLRFLDNYTLFSYGNDGNGRQIALGSIIAQVLVINKRGSPGS
jgi:hypothetical protein